MARPSPVAVRVQQTGEVAFDDSFAYSFDDSNGLSPAMLYIAFGGARRNDSLVGSWTQTSTRPTGAVTVRPSSGAR
jgi:hypothetical protein